MESSIVTKCALVIDALVKAKNPMVFSEIVAATGLVKSSCHRILAILQGEGLIAYDGDQRTYRYGPRLQSWTKSVWLQPDLQDAAIRPMNQLRELTGMNTALSILDEDAVLYLRTSDDVPVRYAAHPGDRAPLHCTAAGKIFLSCMSSARRQRLLAAAPLERFTEYTLTDPAALERECARVVTQGHAVALREEFLQVMGCAAPIRNVQNQVTASLSLWTLTVISQPDDLLRFVPDLMAAADRISTSLGWSER